MKVTKTVCDNCGEQVSYSDIDGDKYDVGFTLEGEPLNIRYHNHCPTSSGHSSSPIPEFVLPENICTKHCMVDYFNKWLNTLPEITDGRR